MKNKIININTVQEAFAQWRKNKKPGARIPEYLWDQVKEIWGHYSPSLIGKRLSISSSQLRTQGILIERGSQYQNSTQELPELVPVINAAPESTLAQPFIELHRADGSILIFNHLSDDRFQLLLKTFMEQGNVAINP